MVYWAFLSPLANFVSFHNNDFVWEQIFPENKIKWKRIKMLSDFVDMLEIKK